MLVIRRETGDTGWTLTAFANSAIQFAEMPTAVRHRIKQGTRRMPTPDMRKRQLPTGKWSTDVPEYYPCFGKLAKDPSRPDEGISPNAMISHAVRTNRNNDEDLW